MVWSEADLVDGVVDEVHLRIEDGIGMFERQYVSFAKRLIVKVAVRAPIGAGFDVFLGHCCDSARWSRKRCTVELETGEDRKDEKQANLLVQQLDV